MSEQELRHHGVKGMKWGVRKKRDKNANGVGRAKRLSKVSKSDTSDIRAKFGRMIRLNKCKTKQDIQDWSESEDARIRDDLHYGKITKDQAKRRWDSLANETSFALKHLHSSSSTLHWHMSSAHFAAQQHQQMVDQFMLQNHINQIHMNMHMSGFM